MPTRQDSVRAVGALEQILQLPPTSLLKLLANAQAGDGLEATRRGGGSDDRGGALGELLDSVPGSRRHDVEVVSRHEKVVVDADGCLATLWVRTVVRARTDGVDRYIVRCFAEEDGSVDEVRVYPLANCRLGQVHRHATAPIFLAEVLFDEALRAGDSWVFEFEVANGGGSRLYEFAHNFTHPVDHYLVEVRFDPAALPVDCYAYVRPGLYDEYRRIETLTLNRHHAVHHMASNLTAGVLGIAWTWPDAADHRQSTG